MGEIKEDELFFCSGFLCCFSALYVACPGCIGCQSFFECCCIEEELCLKADRLSKDGIICCTPCFQPNHEAVCCRLGLLCVGCSLKCPTHCCKNRGQCCCLYSAGSFPTDSEIPVTCGLCFCSCCPKLGCFQTIGDFK